MTAVKLANPLAENQSVPRLPKSARPALLLHCNVSQSNLGWSPLHGEGTRSCAVSNHEARMLPMLRDTANGSARSAADDSDAAAHDEGVAGLFSGCAGASRQVSHPVPDRFAPARRRCCG